MKTKIISALLAVSLLLAPAASFAAKSRPVTDAPTASAKTQCRDAKGKFTKCPTMSAKPKQCRDAKGKFTKCPA
jgi:hypothetical protein